jgi:hypothetical protein
MSDKMITIICIVIPCLVVLAGIGLWFMECAAQEKEMYDRHEKKKRSNEKS